MDDRTFESALTAPFAPLIDGTTRRLQAFEGDSDGTQKGGVVLTLVANDEGVYTHFRIGGASASVELPISEFAALIGIMLRASYSLIERGEFKDLLGNQVGEAYLKDHSSSI